MLFLFGMIATGSSLVNCVGGEVLCMLLVETREYSLETFCRTHTAGAVGRKLA